MIMCKIFGHKMKDDKCIRCQISRGIAIWFSEDD